MVGVLALAQWAVMQRVFAQAPLPSVYLLIPIHLLASALAFHVAWARDPSDHFSAGLERITEDAEDSDGDAVDEPERCNLSEGLAAVSLRSRRDRAAHKVA